MQERIAVIDLGSNTTRLIVMGYSPHHSFKLLDEVRETVRLAEGVGDDGRLTAAAMERAVGTMRLFNSYCQAAGVRRIVATATSATRDATNQAEFLARVESEAGLKMRVLSTEEEAYYGYLGAANALDLRDAILMDIGGGSLQVTAVRGRRMVHSLSRPAGAVRFSERYIHSDPISGKDFRALEAAAVALFADVEWLNPSPGLMLAGIGGTIRTLAEVDQLARSYPIDRIHGYTLTAARLDEIVEQLRGLTMKQRGAVPGVGRDRADLIIAGAVAVQQLMRRGGFSEMVVSGQGLREGLFYEHYLVGEQPPLFSDPRGASVQNVARLYNYDAIHAAKVRDLSLSLFDQLRALHNYGEWERELLGYAATLHDIGVAVSYYDHHRHGEYLILNAPLQGFTHREVALLALLVRYHRKGNVRVEPYSQILQPEDTMRVARLAALLRLAEYLERSKSQIVGALQVEMGDPIRVRVRSTGDATVEIWEANRHADLFASAYGREIEIG